MSEDIIELIDAHDKLVMEAVEAERERNATAVADVILKVHARCEPGPPQWSDLDACADAVLGITSQSQPPPPEPMTVQALIDKVRGRADYDWSRFEDDLQRLVKDQARRDAVECLSQQQASRGSLHDVTCAHDIACRENHDAIRKAAGLE